MLCRSGSVCRHSCTLRSNGHLNFAFAVFNYTVALYASEDVEARSVTEYAFPLLCRDFGGDSDLKVLCSNMAVGIELSLEIG